MFRFRLPGDYEGASSLHGREFVCHDRTMCRSTHLTAGLQGSLSLGSEGLEEVGGALLRGATGTQAAFVFEPPLEFFPDEKTPD